MTVEEILERLKGLQRYHVVASDYFWGGTSLEKSDNGYYVQSNQIDKLIHEIEATQ
jgi:hypothetical protein